MVQLQHLQDAIKHIENKRKQVHQKQIDSLRELLNFLVADLQKEIKNESNGQVSQFQYLEIEQLTPSSIEKHLDPL